jgi:hypothetical protein
MAGTDGIVSINGLEGFVIQEPEASPYDIHGGPVNAAHAHYGEVASPYPWQMTQYGGTYDFISPVDGMVEQYFEVLESGTIDQDPRGDQTPYTHAAPWPKDPIGDGSIGPENTAKQLNQNKHIHASNTGASRRQLYTRNTPVNDTWKEVWVVSPGTISLESSAVPHQVSMAAGGFGSRNRGTTPSPQNSYGYDAAHMHRRFATGSIPGNYMYLKPGGRPMVKSISRIGYRNWPTGPNTPFYGDDPTASFDTYGAVLTGTPPEYISPPQPMTGAAPGANSEMGGTTDFGFGVW